MANNFYTTSSFEHLNINNLSDGMIVCDENLDSVSVLFEYLFTTEQNLKSQNKYLILFLQHYINEDIEMINRLAIILDKSFLDLLPSECFVQNNNEQKGGVVVILGTINNLSEKLIEQYEERIKDLKEIINNQKNK
jgi:hypothetical protein